MNHWNCVKESVVEPAGMLIPDDVYLLEGPLRELFTVSLRHGQESNMRTTPGCPSQHRFRAGRAQTRPARLARLACYLLNCPRTAPAGKTVLWTLT
jgi:hypothetical protein